MRNGAKTWGNVTISRSAPRNRNSSPFRLLCWAQNPYNRVCVVPHLYCAPTGHNLCVGLSLPSSLSDRFFLVLGVPFAFPFTTPLLCSVCSPHAPHFMPVCLVLHALWMWKIRTTTLKFVPNLLPMVLLLPKMVTVLTSPRSLLQTAQLWLGRIWKRAHLQPLPLRSLFRTRLRFRQVRIRSNLPIIQMQWTILCKRFRRLPQPRHDHFLWFPRDPQIRYLSTSPAYLFKKAQDSLCILHCILQPRHRRVAISSSHP